ncbi:MAG: secretin N-terminal domain-containing protein [Phycisphaerales bacterium]
MSDQTRACTVRPPRSAILCSVFISLLCAAAAPALAQNGEEQQDESKAEQVESDLERRSREVRERQAERDRLNAARLQEARRERGLDPETGEDFSNGPLVPLDGRDADGAFLRNADGMVEINLSGEVRLITVLNLVAEALDINVFADPQVEAGNHSVYFKAPLEIPAEHVLPLLEVLLEEKGFVLTRDQQFGWYSVKGLQEVLPQTGATRIITTSLIKPSRLKTELESILTNQGQQVRINAIDEVGLLMVTGGVRAQETVESLIDQIKASLADQKFHQFQLTNIAADRALQRIFELNGLAAGQGGGAATRSIPQPSGGVAGVPSGALINLEDRLLVDQGNALIFRGTDEESEQILEWIELVDQLTQLRLKRYAAGRVVLDVVYAAEQIGLGSVNTQGASNQLGGTGSGGFGQQSRNLPLGGQQQASSVAGSQFLVDLNTGSFIYIGTDAQHEFVKNLVDEFRKNTIGNKIEIRMYKLHHADAETIAELLDNLINQNTQVRTGSSPFLPQSRESLSGLDQQSLEQFVPEEQEQAAAQPTETEGGGTLLNVNADTTSIVADPERNQVVIRASASDHRTFDSLIDQLDQRQPQVHVQVQIVSITTLDQFDWSVELQINEGDFLAFTSFGLGSAGETALDPRIVPTGRSGLTSAVLDSDYLPIVFNVLETVGDTRIVSAPEILVNDNEEAILSSQRFEPFATTSQGTSTTLTSQGGTAEAGTELTVTPTISDGGFLKLEYDLSLSSFDFGSAQPNLQPPKQEESYTSIVTIPSGSTIVVGGLRLQRESENIDQIPILGDLPLVGPLFQDISTSTQVTTIYVFITPTIQADPTFTDLRILTEGPAREMRINTQVLPLDPVRMGLIRDDDDPDRIAPVNNP